jgi:hypothetical protein
MLTLTRFDHGMGSGRSMIGRIADIYQADPAEKK